VGTELQYLGKYELLERLGFGGIAEGWKAFDIQLQRYVVVKIPHADLQNNPDFMVRFWSLPLDQEVQVIASLHHPNIARIHGFQVSLPQASRNPLAYMVMDYIEGQSLADYIRNASFNKGEFSPAADLLRLFASLAAAIDYAHQQGIIHGNIKPSNILLDKRDTSHNPMGEPMLMDFGITRLLGISAGALSHWESDSPSYISPEQAGGHPGNERSDIYALAVILYEMCTGVQPFRGENAQDVLIQQVSTMPPAPKEINPAILPTLSAIIMRNLAKDPAERFPSATTMAVALEKALDTSNSETIRLPPYPKNTIKGTSTHSSTPSNLLTALGSSETSSASIFTAQTSPQPSVPVSPLSVTPSPLSPPGLIRSRRWHIKKLHIALIITLLILLVALILAALLIFAHG
jgi:eukaryotic-like serine/threonine-protein kinase